MLLSKHRIKELVKLSRKKYRLCQGQVVVEGVNTIEQLISNGIMPLALYYSKASEVVQRCSSIPAFEITDNDLGRICRSETPPPLAALYAIPPSRTEDYHRAFYLDRISDPGNLGTIFRIASAFGFDAVILSDHCCDPYSPKVIRASLGSVFWIPSFEGGARWLAEQDAQLVVLTMKADKSIKNMALHSGKRIIAVIGSEAHGVNHEITQLPSQQIRIDMQTGMESLNAAVVAGIVAYQISTLLDSGI